MKGVINPVSRFLSVDEMGMVTIEPADGMALRSKDFVFI